MMESEGCVELWEWIKQRIALKALYDHVIVVDPWQLARRCSQDLDAYAQEQGFAVIRAATNLAFRELYAATRRDPAITHILLIDETPIRRLRRARDTHSAPPLLYPDMRGRARQCHEVRLDPRAYLVDRTNDPNWPERANDDKLTDLLLANVERVVIAHDNLRKINATRFTDSDFATILAYAALDIPEAAFTRHGSADYWKIGLERHGALRAVADVAPEVAEVITAQLRLAPAPFQYLADHDPARVIQAFYLTAIARQYVADPLAVVARVDPSLATFARIDDATLAEALPKILTLDRAQALSDIASVERRLTGEAVDMLCMRDNRLASPARIAATLRQEQISIRLRCLILLAGLVDVLGPRPDLTAHGAIRAALDAPTAGIVLDQADQAWTDLRTAYDAALEMAHARAVLAGANKALKVLPSDELQWDQFVEWWVDGQVGRLEYLAAAVLRLVVNRDLLGWTGGDLPATFKNWIDQLTKRAGQIQQEMTEQLQTLNRAFQDLIQRDYADWLANDGPPVLTSQFIRRVLAAHWDPRRERAMVFVFDGMRYDVWRDLLWPQLAGRMEIVADRPGCALLPSETHISRWALAAGEPPRDFTRASGGNGENVHLRRALQRQFDLDEPFAVPEQRKVGETVHYRSRALDYDIFYYLDHEMHGIEYRNDQPSKTYVAVYDGLIRDFIQNEALAALRDLPPGTLVFITSDHGFGPVGKHEIWFDDADLAVSTDCKYLNARTQTTRAAARPQRRNDRNQIVAARDEVVAFTTAELGLPEKVNDDHGPRQHRAVFFPRPGYVFSRSGSATRPDAYSHGGVSLQELLVPMAVLRVKTRDAAPVILGNLAGPAEAALGDEPLTYTLTLTRAASEQTTTRVDLAITCGAPITGRDSADPVALPGRAILVGERPVTVQITLTREQIAPTEAEVRQGFATRDLVVTPGLTGVRQSLPTVRKTVKIRLGNERVQRRVDSQLGNLLGLMPRA